MRSSLELVLRQKVDGARVVVTGDGLAAWGRPDVYGLVTKAELCEPERAPLAGPFVRRLFRLADPAGPLSGRHPAS